MLALKLLFRNAFRHRLRTALTVAAVAIAVLAFGLLRTVLDAWYAGVEASSATRLVTRNAISLIFPLPLAYDAKLRQIDGIDEVTYGSWFGGIYIDEKNFFANFAVEPRTYLDIYPEYIVPDTQKTAFLRERNACVAGRKLAARYGWRLGDTITLKGTIFPGDWELVLRGIYRGRDRSTDETAFFFHWAYVNESLRRTAPARADQVGFYIFRVHRPDRAAEVARSVDRAFKNSLAETLTETERAFVMGFITMTEAIVAALRLVSLAVIAIIMVVAANTMAMTARERIGEHAVLKTLGFGALHVGGLIFGESLVLSAAGGVLGILLTFPAARFFELTLSQFFPVFHVTARTVGLDLGAIALVGVVAGLVPTWHAVHVSVAAGLRRIG
ncbi:MAG: ABC transporter permease [Deltaproteobacteria bacterium]|nr:ABC transporter permease [Deltaproteobacteria bacterium]